VTAAVVIAASLMVTLTAVAVVSGFSCQSHPVLVNVAVTDDLAPAVGRVAQLFNRERHQAGGNCAEVQVTEGQSAAVAGQIDGQATVRGLPAIDAWIPDSSLWVDIVRRYPAGARAVRPTGVVVARSPLMIVMPASVAAKMPEFGSPVGWNFLLPPAAGGPSSALGLRVDLPDPTQSAAGLATIVQMSRLLGAGATARTDFTKFVFDSEATAQFDDPASLASFVSLAEPPWNGHPVTITSEQAVVQYDEANPGGPIAARYPSGSSPLLGSPELDYPFVLTTSDPTRLQAAIQFEQVLKQSYAASVVRFDGFRSAGGVADTSPATFGLGAQHLALAAPAGASEAQTTMAIWNNLGLGFRDLSLIDISSAMGKPDGNGSQTFEQELGQTAALGLALFPDSTQMGLWEFSNHLNGASPYQQLVPVGPLPSELGLISRRQQLQQINESIRPNGGSTVALNDSILAAYRTMLNSYKPGYANAILVLTSGIDNAPGDMSLGKLLSTLRALYDLSRRVEIVAVMFGSAGNFSALQQITAATHGGAYEITDPAQVGKVFFEAVAHRTCDPGCAAP
jgi:Bacterial extracellular solute-binding protein/von Willebrand factor type A domain